MGKILNSTFALIAALLVAPSLAATEEALSEFRPGNMAELLDAVGRNVVSIEVERKDGTDLPAARIGEIVGGEEARSYFQRPDGPVTGFLIDGNGHVLTSHYNVVGELESLRVIFASGEKRAAEVIAVSERDDVALLRLSTTTEDEQSALHHPWPDSDGLAAGQIVFAMGRSPYPQTATVTRGIVSATGRNAGRALQTDAKLNYGNVGGPLVDLQGRLVGIACFVGHHQPQWGINSGVGFGTTATTLRRILPRLLEGRDVKPPMLGVFWDGTLAPNGAPVSGVAEGAAAARAGIVAGDILLELDGKKIKDFYHLKSLVLAHEVGESVKVKVRRKDEELTLNMVLGEKP